MSVGYCRVAIFTSFMGVINAVISVRAYTQTAIVLIEVRQQTQHLMNFAVRLKYFTLCMLQIVRNKCCSYILTAVCKYICACAQAAVQRFILQHRVEFLSIPGWNTCLESRPALFSEIFKVQCSNVDFLMSSSYEKISVSLIVSIIIYCYHTAG
jgi:hypothetical protein